MLRLSIIYRNLFNNVQENSEGYAKNVSNFDKYRQNLINFHENVSKIGILSPETTTLNPGIEFQRKKTEIDTILAVN